jgi:PAS domain S-box-containing protein
LGFIIECLFFTVAIWRFSLFGITPASAAEKIISTMREALLLVNPDGTIVTANQAAAKLLNVPEPEKLIGQDAIQFLAPRERENYENRWLPQLQEHGFINETEAYFQTIDNREMAVSLSASILRHDDAHPQGVIYVIRDLTQRKREEQERLEFEHQMHQAQKYESLGILAKGIAHDFNNLLMVILGNSDIALHGLPEDSKAASSIQRIKKTALRSSDLVRQMLTYSGKGRFVLEPIALNTIIKDMQDLLHSSVSKKASLDYDLGKPLAVIEGDLTQIRQVILNLVTNASEALGDRSGRIVVRTSLRTLSKKDLQKMSLSNDARTGNFVQLEVSDEGAGIPPSELSKIFDPFYSTKFPGRGLGLSSVLGIMRELNGYLDVTSQVGVGTQVALGFPTADEPHREIEERTPEPSDWQGKGTLLIVDDEEEVMDVARQFLELLGFDTLQANNGKVAVEKYREMKDKIDVVLLDLTMPEMDGEETYRHLRAINPDINVIIASGYEESEIRERFRGLPLMGVIQKPFQFAELQTRMQQFFQNLKS